MKNCLLFFLGFFLVGHLFSQDSTRLRADSSLGDILVTAFQSHQQWKTVPAAVAPISSHDLERYSNASMLPAFNIIPGARMEERSPNSYRLSLRGSLLRSPFGIRNVKVYWNDIPLTDGGGNTYLNLVDMAEITSAEILKGPVASVYGVGTGGALLLRTDLPFSAKPQNNYTVGTSGGSYGLFSEQAGWEYRQKQLSTSLQQIHQQSDGYRQETASRKDIIKWQLNHQWKSQQLQVLVFYTDLFYQTPGGITLAQMQLNPKLARLASGSIPAAIQQKAAIYNKTIFGAIHHETDLGKLFTLKSFVMNNHTSFDNPYLTDYEKRSEDNTGIGTSLTLHTQTAHTSFQWINGAEWLYNHALTTDYGNRAGVPDTVQFTDNIYANQWFAFSQAQLVINQKWNITAGMSFNNQSYRYKRLTDLSSNYVNRNINAVFTPRLAVLYRLQTDVSAYAMVAKGFSPPALAELRPTDGNYYGNLNAEYGWNYETGIKGMLLNRQLEFDIAVYYFALKDAIVQRSNAAGALYYVNAGGTIEKGIESLVRYQFVKRPSHFFKSCKLWSSYTYQPYRFDNYQQDGINYSGNAVTGVPRNTWVSGIDMETVKGYYLNLSVNSTSSIPLTDANDAYAAAYQLVQMKWGYRANQKANRLHVFMGIDNLLNQVYSLGNDINAAAKRYYNPATGRNFFAGIQYQIH